MFCFLNLNGSACELLQRAGTPVAGALWRSPAATVATPAGATEPHRSWPPAITHPATKWSTHSQYLRFRHLHSHIFLYIDEKRTFAITTRTWRAAFYRPFIAVFIYDFLCLRFIVLLWNWKCTISSEKMDVGSFELLMYLLSGDYLTAGGWYVLLQKLPHHFLMLVNAINLLK